MSNSWPIDRTLSGVTTPGQSGSGSNGNEGVLGILQSFSITGTSPSNYLMSYPGFLLAEEGLTPLKRFSWLWVGLTLTASLQKGILQSQPTRLINIRIKVSTYTSPKFFQYFSDVSTIRYLQMVFVRFIGRMVRVVTNAPGDQGSIPDRVIPKTLKMVFDGSLFNTSHYKVQIKGKWINPGKGVAPFLTPRCSS